MRFELKDQSIFYTRAGEICKLSACGTESLRFQSTASSKLLDQNWTLMPQPAEAKVWMDGTNACIQTGNLRAVMNQYGRVTFYYKDKMILNEKPELAFDCGIRNYRNKGGDLWTARVTFEPNEGEHFYGLGHEATGCFDLKGCSVDLRQINAKCSIPFVYSSLGYGFLWNLPSTGSCELSNNRTRWVSDSTKQIDYVIIGGSPKQVTSMLADFTGHAPMMPDWAMGFWQCRLRYENQEQLLTVARKYKELGIPLSVIVIDYFHWTEQGDYKFEPSCWPNPKEMTKELHDMGIKLMVSMWPTINENSENYSSMLEENMLIRTVSGSNRLFEFHGPQAEIDPTNPKTREYVWNRLKENYIDQGVDALWFDEAEPEIHPEHFDNLIFHIGNGDEIGLLYPNYYSQLVYDGMKQIGRDDIVTLSRCAYLGAQKYGTLVWSGDIPSTFESLSDQIKSGLNMSMCGIPWWTTDIGGFYGGYPETEYFRELIVRWFQYGLFCPIMRLHGNREGIERNPNLYEPSGADNEIWSFGDENYPILRELIELRYRLKPYITKHMQIASNSGIPIMRPMFYDYPDDETCYTLGEQYMFGDDILFAPISRQGQRVKSVYLPKGSWTFVRDGSSYQGEAWYEMSADIDEFIAFVKSDSNALDYFTV